MRYILNYHHQHQPMEDHSFVDDGQLITAKTLKGLVAAVREYRERNFHPAGDPEQEIAQSYCQKYPWLVSALKHPPEGTLGAQESPDEVAARGAVARFVRSIWTNPPKAIFTIDKVEARISACRACPFNEPFDVKAAGGYELVRRIYLLSRGESPAGLGYCPCHQWFNGLAILLPAADKLAKSEMPEECWIKTERENPAVPVLSKGP